MAVCWKDEKDMYMFPCIHPSPTKWILEISIGISQNLISWSSTYGISTKLLGSYGLDVDKIVFFHFLDLCVLITFLCHKSSGGNYSCRWCVLRLIGKLIQDEDMGVTRVTSGGSSLSASCHVQKYGNLFTGLSEEPRGSVLGVASHFTWVCVLRTIAQNKLL